MTPTLASYGVFNLGPVGVIAVLGAVISVVVYYRGRS